MFSNYTTTAYGSVHIVLHMMRQVRRPKNKDESNLIKKATNEAKKTPAQSFPCKIPAKHEFGLAANGQRADIYSSRRGTDFLSIDWALAMCTIGAKRPRDLFLLLSFRVFLLSSQTRMKRLIVKKNQDLGACSKRQQRLCIYTNLNKWAQQEKDITRLLLLYPTFFFFFLSGFW